MERGKEPRSNIRQTSQELQKLLMRSLTLILGKNCKVTTTAGATYKGLIHTYTSNGIILYQNRNPQESIKPIKFSLKDLISIEANSITVAPQKKFKTDREITKSNKKYSRQLQKWESDAPIEETLSKSNEPWDQFKANKEKFNYKSTYSEDIYTTAKVDPRELTEEQLKKAQKVEEELLGTKIEEEFEDVEDEEKKFGAVLGSGRYEENNSQSPPRITRDRAVSIAGDFSIEDYKKFREHLLRNKISISTEMETVNSLCPMIAADNKEEVLREFVKFKRERLPSRREIMEDLKKSSKIIDELFKKMPEMMKKDERKPKGVIDLFISGWKNCERDTEVQIWPSFNRHLTTSSTVPPRVTANLYK
ncbi:unnamed protein product [Blepharisma stoltei]|uniref:LsmAD domain-containing protein n=1 Tax=Blepharisma stoltei TaxID=1481888 RepID=A0AAU9K7U5_9CILI|nr:unnamed protein product [Blepharisma stoltei]